MSDSTHYFTCPSCGAHHFGRDTKRNEVTGRIDILDTVQCHGHPDPCFVCKGEPYICRDDCHCSGTGVVSGRPCGWRGVWNPEEIERPEATPVHA